MSVFISNALFDSPRRQLHGEAVDASVLADDGDRIYSYHVSVWEGKLNLSLRLLVLLRLVVRRINHGTVQNQEVGIGGRQSVSLAVPVCSQSVALVIDGIRHRELQQSVRVSLVGEELLQLLLQRLKILILLILLIITPYI